MIDEKFALLAVIINLIGTAGYIRDTLRGTTKPNRVTWLLWAIAPMIAFAAQLSKGVGLSSIMTFSVGFAPLLVLIASFVGHKAYWKLTKLDVSCGVISLLALMLWLITGDGLVAISLSILADLFAGLPTVTKAYKFPDTETSFAFLLSGISVIITLFTLAQWTFASAGFAIYILIMNTTLFLLIRFPKFLRRSTT